MQSYDSLNCFDYTFCLFTVYLVFNIIKKFGCFKLTFLNLVFNMFAPSIAKEAFIGKKTHFWCIENCTDNVLSYTDNIQTGKIIIPN